MSGTIRTTVKELATKSGVELIVAGGFLRYLEQLGKAKIITVRRSASGKGKPAAVWEVQQPVSLTL